MRGFYFNQCLKVTVHPRKNMKTRIKGSDNDCFSDCWIWVPRSLMKMELMKEDILGVSGHTPACKILKKSL